MGWVRTDSPGVSDEVVLARAEAEGRVLLTFDKDFGELAFRRGLPASCGIVLFRLAIPNPAVAVQRIVGVVEGRSDWIGNFSVVDDARVRVRTLH